MHFHLHELHLQGIRGTGNNQEGSDAPAPVAPASDLDQGVPVGPREHRDDHSSAGCDSLKYKEEGGRGGKGREGEGMGGELARATRRISHYGVLLVNVCSDWSTSVWEYEGNVKIMHERQHRLRMLKSHA